MYKAEEAGIDVVLTEESYTSKVDHLVNESLGPHSRFLGQRIRRGLFKSSCGRILNADINGAIGILRKVNAISDANIVSLRDRGDVVSPIVLKYGL
jgi:putative transposase